MIEYGIDTLFVFLLVFGSIIAAMFFWVRLSKKKKMDRE
ncbi:EYxxD motif small membrane protein [Bacillus shivajii]